MIIHAHRHRPACLFLKLLVLAAGLQMQTGSLLANAWGKPPGHLPADAVKTTAFPLRQANNISIICKGQPLKWIIKQFEKQSGLSFVYSNDDLDINKKYSVVVKKMPWIEALQCIFSPLKR